MSEIPQARLQVIVVWEPVLWTDLAPPTTYALRRISDPRTAQFWDPSRLLSSRMAEARDDVVWDYVAIHPAGALWGSSPPPAEFDGAPVVEVIDEVRRRLAALAGP